MTPVEIDAGIALDFAGAGEVANAAVKEDDAGHGQVDGGFEVLLAFGGDGIKEFALPNLAPVQCVDGKGEPVRYIICLNGVFPQRN